MNGLFDNRVKDRYTERGGSSARAESSRQKVSTLQCDVLSLQRAVGNRAVSDLVRDAGGLGAGLQDVRIHTGEDADTRTEAEGAFAFARGRDLYFGSDVDLETGFGQRVLAHELTHVIQQARGRIGIAQASQSSLEGEASNVSGVGAPGAVGAGGAAPAGSVQKLEKQGVPESDEEERQWSIDVDSDAQKLTDILSSTFYSDADESEAIATLNRWARRQRRSERKKADREAGNLDRGLQFGMKGSYLDRLFLRLRSTQIWTRYGRTTAYEAMFEHFDRAQEVRTIRDTYSINYAGREEKADTASDERKEEDLLGENLFGWRTNRVESAGIASSPDAKAKAAWVIRRLAELRPEQLTPKTRLLSEGVAREGEDFLLKRTHVVTAGDRLRLIKGVAREAVVTMLEFAVWELGIAAAEAIAPELLAGAGGAEATGAERAAAREGEQVATKAGAESAAAKEAAPKAVGDDVTSIVGTPRRGPIEGLGGEGEVIDINRSPLKKGPEPPPPSEPASQATPTAANDNVEIEFFNENQMEIGVRKAVNAGEYSQEPTISMAGKAGSKSLSRVPKLSSIPPEIYEGANPLEGSLSAPRAKPTTFEAGSAEQEASLWQPIDENVVPRAEVFEPPPAIPSPPQIRQAPKTIGRKPPKQMAPDPVSRAPSQAELLSPETPTNIPDQSADSTWSKAVDEPQPTLTTQNESVQVQTSAAPETSATDPLGQRVQQAEAEFNAKRAEVLEYQAERKAAGESLKGGPSKGLWNLQEKLWVLKRQRAYPNRQLLEQARIVGVRSPNGAINRAEEIAEEGRIFDFLEIGEKRLIGGDIKSTEEFKSSIKGGLKRSKSTTLEFRPSSKIGGQHTKELKLIEDAKQSGGKLVIRGVDVRTGETVIIEVDASNLDSIVITYADVYPN
jgi:hypothetical protein